MLYRVLGRTGLQVSVIGFGAATLGNEYGELDAEPGKAAVHAAIDQGVNFFDTSPYYGRTLSETRLGEALVHHRHKIILATKCGRYDKDKFDFSAERLTHSIEESLTRLKTDYIDLYQLHDIEFAQPQQIIDEAIPTLFKLRDQGKIRFVGITGYPLPLLKKVAEASDIDAILSYCHYNLLNTGLADSLALFAQSRGIALINASPLHMGVLTEQGAPTWHPAPQTVHDKAAEAARLAKTQGTDLTTLALQFALAYPDVAITLIGMRTPQEVSQNLALVGKAVDETLLSEIQAVLAPVKNINWQSGLPQNYEPGAVPIRNA